MPITETCKYHKISSLISIYIKEMLKLPKPFPQLADEDVSHFLINKSDQRALI